MSRTVLYEGPDISRHNGNVNIKAVRDAGYRRVGIRAGYGRGNVDQKYIVNAQACRNLGMPVMPYWFSYAYTPAMAAAEADFAIEQVKKFWSAGPIAYDFEYDSVNYARKNGVDISKSLATDMAIAFLRKIRSVGYIPVLYANKDYLKNYFDRKRIAAEVGTLYLWYARYTVDLPEAELAALDVWQYTSSGKIPGVNGRVDLNRFYVDFDKPDEPVDTTPKSNINIRNFQLAANADGYLDMEGKPLSPDGIDGPRTQYVRRQIVLKAQPSGKTYKTGSTGEVVRWVQTRLKEMGYHIAVDGKYGRSTRAAVIRFQKEHGLIADGIAGYNTIQMLFYA